VLVARDRQRALALSRQPRESPTTTAPNGPRPPPRSPTTSTCCWPPTTSPLSTGSTYGPRTRSSPPSGRAHQSPRDPAPAPPASLPVRPATDPRSSCSHRPPAPLKHCATAILRSFIVEPWRQSLRSAHPSHSAPRSAGAVRQRLQTGARFTLAAAPPHQTHAGRPVSLSAVGGRAPGP
jgi:hypothetical protein